LQYIVWKDDPTGFKGRLERFLALAHKHGITTTLVLFDDCAFGNAEPHLGKQADPVPGVHNSCWTPSPGHAEAHDQADWPGLQKYVQDVVGSYGQDRRVLMWDLYNEPHDAGSVPLLEACFAWARTMRPSQPLSSGVWGGPDTVTSAQLALSDVITFHCYSGYAGVRGEIAKFKLLARPVINTEWMARPLGGYWATDLPLFKTEGVGCYNWGLVNGRTQTQYPWGSKPGDSEPAVWFHDLFHKDGKPYDVAEIAAIRRTSADKTIDWSAADYATTLSAPEAPAHIDSGVQFSYGWTHCYLEQPVPVSHLEYANSSGATATFTTKGTAVTLVTKAGPDCGIAQVYIDGAPATPAEIDTYAPDVDWRRKTVLAQDLPDTVHRVTVQVTGRKNEKSSNAYIQIVGFEQAGAL
jgi:hypothetical protein